MPTREELHREIEDAGRAHDARVVRKDRFEELTAEAGVVWHEADHVDLPAPDHKSP